MKCGVAWWQRFLLSLNTKVLGDYIYLFPKMAENKPDNAGTKNGRNRNIVLKLIIFYVLVWIFLA